MTNEMRLLPVHTGLLKKGSLIVEAIENGCNLEDGDIVAVSAKACATCEGSAIDLATIAVTSEAEKWAQKCGRTPEFRQAVLHETQRMHGTVIGGCPMAMLCELRPDGMEEGTILAVNAGLDKSNAGPFDCAQGKGFAIGWPKDPMATVRKIRDDLREATGKTIAVILTDSCCRPRRLGVTAVALTVCGFDPLESQIGREDLFGHALTMTHEARADQLATAANFLMGNAAQSIPAAVIREHGLPMTDFCGWVPGISRDEDLFQGLF